MQGRKRLSIQPKPRTHKQNDEDAPQKETLNKASCDNGPDAEANAEGSKITMINTPGNPAGKGWAPQGKR